MLPAGVPGTGHILVFDNGNNSVNYNPRKKDGRPNSRVVEINPLDNSIAWQYTAEMSNRPTWSFFSHYISSAQRQPNGNTLICEGSNGRFFEVTRSGEIVWEYINPFPNLSGKIPNSTVFRVAKVPGDWLKR
jgi:Arylsulfotransferase (ASST)